MPHDSDPRHPIGVVAERTGLTPDVLRVWERRYGVVEPSRSAGGQRVYSDADIERLSLLHRATRGGHNISHVATLSREKLEDLVRDVESAAASPGRFVSQSDPAAMVDQAIIFTRALNPGGVETLLRRGVARHGLITFIDSIAAPFLRAVGDAWHAGTITVAMEHLATAIVQRVVSETSPLLTGADGSPTIVIGTLEGERHAAGALMAAATAASEGWRVIYLGADLPPEEFVETAVRTRASAVGISVVVPEKKSRMTDALTNLKAALPDAATLVVGGAGSEILRPNLGAGVVLVESMAELNAELSMIKARA